MAIPVGLEGCMTEMHILYQTVEDDDILFADFLFFLN